MLFVGCCVLFVVWRLRFDVCCVLFDVCLSIMVSRWWFVFGG